LVTKLETNHAQIDEMMVLHVQDGLGAMRYGQYGGSTPDPTARTVIAPDGALHVFARNNTAENDRTGYWQDLKEVERILERMDDTRRRYMSANLDIRNRLDPTDFCAIHFALHLYEGHRRVKGNLCKICAGFYDEHKREPTGTEADYFHRHGRWPHRPVDPKERRPA
jgi:hypothetical protein